MSAGQTNLLTGWEESPERVDGAFRVMRISVGGDPHAKAILDAVLDRYNAVLDRPRPTDEVLLDLVDHKVTLIQYGENAFGSGILAAQEGKLFASNGGYGILPPRARSKGLRVRVDKLLDVLPGYAVADATEMVRRVRDGLPTLKALTQERLNDLPPSSQTLSLCIFGEYRMPDSAAKDALYLASNYMRGDDIVEGVLLIRPEHGFSEHGSIWGRQLLGNAMGEVVGFQPISFAEGIHLCSLDFDEAYEQVIGKVDPVQDAADSAPTCECGEKATKENGKWWVCKNPGCEGYGQVVSA